MFACTFNYHGRCCGGTEAEYATEENCLECDMFDCFEVRKNNSVIEKIDTKIWELTLEKRDLEIINSQIEVALQKERAKVTA